MKRDDARTRGSSAIDEEIDYHLERTAQEFIAAGHSSSDARRLALQRFGDLAHYRKRMMSMQRAGGRRMSLQTTIERVLDDMRFGVRYARRTPGLTLGVALTIALGVGANATMYSVIDRILLTAPPHIQSADQVKRLFVERSFLGTRYVNSTVTYPDVEDWHAAESFSSVAAFSQETMTLGVGENARRLPAVYVSHEFFPLLGTSPHQGRLFTPEDDVRGAEPVAILGYDFWQREFGGSEDALGALLDLGHARYRIVGVAPRGFTGVDLDRVDLWLPLFTHEDVEFWADSRGYYHLHVIARLAESAKVAAAASEATLLHRQGRADNTSYDPEAAVRVSPLLLARGPRASDESVVARWLAGVSLFVLIIACSNVANLLLAHGARQRREIAVRLALGVSRARLVRQLLWGSLVFAALGGVGALALAHWGGVLVGRVLLPDVDWSSGVVSPRILMFTIAVAVLAGVMASLVPAIRSSRGDLMNGLTHGARGASARRSRLRWSLLVAQAALSTVLLVGSGLFIKSLQRVENVDLGFDPENVFVVSVQLPTNPPLLFDTTATRRDASIHLHQRALERIQQMPFVELASMTSTVPFANSMSLSLRASGRDSLPTTSSGGPYILSVTPDYFDVMDLQIIRGRTLEARDVTGAPFVALVNETMGRLVWPQTDPIGQCLYIDEGRFYAGGDRDDIPCSEVVGIVEDSHRQEVIESEQMLYYVSAPQFNIPPRSLMVRTTMPADQAAPTLKRAVFDVAPEARFVRVQPMTDLVSPDFRSWRLGASVFTAFGVLALVVAAVGLYSVLAFDVAQRSTEIGVRSALGATHGRLMSWIVREGLTLVSLGIVIGGGTAMLAGGAIQSLLYETSARDPMTYGLVAAVLVAVAVMASLLPALRATRVEPVEALRTD